MAAADEFADRLRSIIFASKGDADLHITLQGHFTEHPRAPDDASWKIVGAGSTRTWLHVVAGLPNGGHEKSAEFLIKKGIDASTRDNDSGQTALHIACSTEFAPDYGVTDLMQVLIRAGVGLDVTDHDGKTARSLATHGNKTKLDIAVANNNEERRRSSAVGSCHT